ncbi:hypothetical protein BDP81DRAFT_219845 [Colletotrichum phormii]|uniref:Uncharacterized protein n=1 Tax=Colletotrichum phormii TaxID=359342 RepID=A0AAJ0EEL6_9PEZI|nr:uncharacterized protein BDP81DRAFT_219845 [Colletotrichum phormii]KAK1637177.1 hypothetical protein BDP81DRAFT_219845 [Colletotrichum phormii]
MHKRSRRTTTRPPLHRTTVLRTNTPYVPLHHFLLTDCHSPSGTPGTSIPASLILIALLLIYPLKVPAVLPFSFPSHLGFSTCLVRRVVSSVTILHSPYSVPRGEDRRICQPAACSALPYHLQATRLSNPSFIPPCQATKGAPYRQITLRAALRSPEKPRQPRKALGVFQLTRTVAVRPFTDPTSSL